MLKHYVHIGLRILSKQGVYLWINIVGLAIGLTIVTLISLLVLKEATVDQSTPGVERIYRIAHDVKVNDRELHFPLTPGPLALRLSEGFPGVEAVCRLFQGALAISYRENQFLEDRFVFADPSFLSIFPLHFVAGDADLALREPNSIILTQESARKYFAVEPPLGRSLLVSGRPYRVTGVVEDISKQSHLAFDFMAPLSSLRSGDWIDRWSAHNFYTYVKLRPGYHADALQRQLDDLTRRELGPLFAEGIGKSFPQFLKEGQRFGYFLQPLAGIHLDSHLEHELRPNSDRKLVASLAVIALLVLLIACSNYMNLATARASKRALEVGLRKTLGAEKNQLITQFMIEAAMTTLAAAVLSILLLMALQRRLTSLSDVNPLFLLTSNPGTIALCVVGLAIIALISGAYPAFVLSSLQPINMLKKGRAQKGGGKWLRDLLVVLQFTIAITFLAITLVVDRQMSFLRNKDLGFHPKGVLLVNGISLLGDHWQAFKQEVSRIPGVIAVSAASSVPGRNITKGYLYPGISTRQEDLVTTWVLEADADFARVLQMRLIAGRDFSPAEMQSGDVVLVNSMIPERFDWPTPVGQLVTVGKVPGTIRGVFSNIYLESLHQPLRETVIRPLMARPQVMAIRIGEGDSEKVIPQLAACWQMFATNQPFDTSALDQEIAAIYEPEIRLMEIGSAFTLIAAFLACLGIAGLSAFIAEQRVREVGIRKVMGATVGEITILLTWDLLRLVMLGFLVALPFAWCISSWWLGSFVFSTNIPVWLFPSAGMLITIVALLTVNVQAIRAARINPALSLRCE